MSLPLLNLQDKKLEEIVDIILNDDTYINDVDFKSYFNKNLLYKINRLFEATIKDINKLERLLNLLVEYEKDLVDSKIDDGYFIYLLIDDYITNSCENNIALKFFLIDFIYNNFSDDIKTNAAIKKMDYDLKLSIKPMIYYQIGSTVIYGSFYQTDELYIKPIEWDIIDIVDDCFILLSKYGIDSTYYDDKDSMWHDSHIRKFLNDYFYNRSFNEEEKENILEIMCYETDELFRTVYCKDKVSLLSHKQFINLLTKKEKDKKYTDYSLKRNEYKADSISWRLKSDNYNHKEHNAVYKEMTTKGEVYNSEIRNNYYVVPVIKAKKEFLIENELKDKVFNNSVDNKLTTIKDINVENQKVSIISYLNKYEIEDYLLLKGACVFNINNNPKYVIFDDRSYNYTFSSIFKAYELENNGETQIIPYSLFKYLNNDLDSIDISNKDVMYFVSRHYLMNKELYDEDYELIDVINNFLKDKKTVYKKISELQDKNFLKAYIIYQDEMNYFVLNKTMSNNYINYYLLRLVDEKWVIDNKRIYDVVKTFIITKSNYFIESFVGYFDDNKTLKLLKYYIDNNADFSEYFSKGDRNFYYLVLKYILSKKKDNLTEYFIINIVKKLNLCLNTIIDKTYLNNSSNLSIVNEFITYLKEYDCLNQINYNSLTSYGFYIIVKHLIDKNFKIDNELKKTIDKRAIDLLSNGYSKNIYKYLIDNYDGNEIIIDEYKDFILDLLLYYLKRKYKNNDSKFIESMKNNFIKFSSIMFYKSSSKIDIVNYIIEVADISYLKLEELNDDELSVIFNDFIDRLNIYPIAFKNALNKLILYKLRKLSFGFFKSGNDYDSLSRYLKEIEAYLIENGLSDNNFYKWILISYYKKFNWNNKFNYWVFKILSKDELESDYKPDMNYVIYSKME